MVGRVFPSARTTASAIESTTKGATGPEESVETTIGVGDDTGNSSELSPADKLLLVERGGFGIMFNQNRKERGKDEPKNTTASDENHDRRMAKFLIYWRASIDEPETTGEETAVVTEEDSIKSTTRKALHEAS